jgi:hypothetical protein
MKLTLKAMIFVLCATFGFFLGGYFMIQHALDLTDHNYWREVNNCNKTVGGSSRCGLAYDSMVLGSIFEFIAFAGFCITTSYLISPECGRGCLVCIECILRSVQVFLNQILPCAFRGLSLWL